jgi:hypothetical protein
MRLNFIDVFIILIMVVVNSWLVELLTFFLMLLVSYMDVFRDRSEIKTLLLFLLMDFRIPLAGNRILIFYVL